MEKKISKKESSRRVFVKETEPNMNGSETKGSDVEEAKSSSKAGLEGKTKESISSNALVQYNRAEPPMLPYARLQQDTDLKIAPANWLRDGRFSNIFHRQTDPVEFSSFGMAHSFPDIIKDVDVISDAENIKKLLKIPYSKTEVSLAVHKVGRTLLVDEIDIPGLISYTSQRGDAPDFSWLSKLYCEQTGIPQGAGFTRKKKNKDQTKQRDIFSKFLHYSIQSEVDGQKVECEESVHGAASSTIPRDSSKESTKPVVPIITEQVLPEPQQGSPFQRNIVWQFEDIHMLVGSNMPIFGGGKWPAISLRLRECGKPISVLTGLDSWLDNLMCNVPEVIMCYHLDGIVQYYDLCKTQDLPSMEGSQFSPKVVKDIAQNMLSFMKSNCTQEGHTYWLFKGSDSEVVKLYDLTSICDQNEEDKNPFTVPVAMLLYRVAKNMLRDTPLNAMDQGTVRLLLNNCLVLLEKQAFPEIVTSANFLLSDLYSPDDIHTLPALITGQPDTSKEFSFEDVETLCREDSGVTSVVHCLDVGKLSIPGICEDTDQMTQMNKPLPRNVEERCKGALAHIAKGLLCLKMVNTKDMSQEEGANSSSSTEPLAAVSPNSPVTLSFRRIQALPSGEPQAVVPSYSKDRESYDQGVPPLIVVKPANWQVTNMALLLRKAGSVYHSLASVSNTNGKYGRGLRFCKLALKCLGSVQSLQSFSEEQKYLLGSVLCACADSCLMLAKFQGNLSVHYEDFNYLSPDDQFIASSADACMQNSPVETLSTTVQFISDKEKSLLKSDALYQTALDLTSEDTNSEHVNTFTRRLGNAKNELGVFYMNQAASLMETGTEPSNRERKLWEKSISYFDSGIHIFEVIQDRGNMALLLSNSGRLMRLCAQAVGGALVKGKTCRGEFSQEEKTYYNRAFEFYNKALRCLSVRKTFPEVWDTVTWELSGAYFSMATLLQDYAPLSLYAQERVEQEVTELMMKALRLCEPSGPSSKVQVKPQSEQQLEFRIGSIHHRLASLYHNSFRNQAVDQTKKTVRSLADLHYTKACANFKPDSYPCQWIRIQLERVAMCEYHVNHYGGSTAALRTLQTALDYILLTKNALRAITNIKDNSQVEKEGESSKKTELGQESLNKKTSPDFVTEELKSLLPILESRLTGLLKELLRMYSQKKNKARASSDNSNLECVKQMYCVALRACSNSEQQDIVVKCRHLADTFETLEKMKTKIS